MYNITKMTHEDGSLWDYLYDGRYRLTKATRSNAASPNDTIKAVYEYTYDDGNNLTTKVTPFEDNFNDGNYTGWSVNWGTWTATNDYVVSSYHATQGANLLRAQTDGDFELRFRYLSEDTSSNDKYLRIIGRFTSAIRVEPRFYPDKAELREYDGTSWTILDTNTSATTVEDTW